MSENIKTGAEIYNMGKYSPDKKIRDGINFAVTKWVSVSWLKEQVQKEHSNIEMLPGDIKDIRDLGRMDSLRWVLSLLEEKKP